MHVIGAVAVGLPFLWIAVAAALVVALARRWGVGGNTQPGRARSVEPVSFPRESRCRARPGVLLPLRGAPRPRAFLDRRRLGRRRVYASSLPR